MLVVGPFDQEQLLIWRITPRYPGHHNGMADVLPEGATMTPVSA